MDEVMEVINFIKKVYEYFLTDYFYVMDFLNDDTPWDRDFMFALGIDKEKLDRLKDSMLTSMVQTYLGNILSLAKEKHQVSLVDEKIVNSLNRGKKFSDIIMNNRDSLVIVERFFLKTISTIKPIKVDTHNDFDENIMNITDIFFETYSKYNGTERILEDPNNEGAMELFEQVYEEVYAVVAKYLQVSFRTISEEEDFLNYLFSIAYTHLYLEQQKDELDPSELAIMSIVENDIDVRDVFYNNATLASEVIDIVSSAYYKFGRLYDMRHSIKDRDVQSIFKRLDSNYDNKFEQPIMYYDFSIDERLEDMLDLLGQEMSTVEIYDLLTTNASIYDFLMDNDLDGRFEQFFKSLLVGKIVGDVLELECYKEHTSGSKIYSELIKVAKNDTAYLYFFNHAGTLFDTYYSYHSQSEEFIDKVRRTVKAHQEIPYVTRINRVAIGHYFDKPKELPSVDYINYMLTLSKESNFEMILKTIALDERRKLIGAMCVNVYENLVLEKTTSDEIKATIALLEESDVVQKLLDDEITLMRIVRLFKLYNSEKLSYGLEHSMRSKLRDKKYVKILEQLNPFSSEEKEQ